MSTHDEYAAFAREHLPPALADQWTGLLRPGAGLFAAEPGEASAVRLGGQPRLPADTAWPRWEGHGPLSFIADVDCAAVTAASTATGLPDGGRLLLFYYDGEYDDHAPDSFVGFDRESQAGARVLYVPAAQTAEVRATPDGLKPYPPVALSAREVTTTPSLSSETVLKDFGIQLSWDTGHPLWAQDFQRGLSERVASYHQLGGHAHSLQNDVTFDAARDALGGHARPGQAALLAEAAHWRLLAQISSDEAAAMMWGDCGILYWLIRHEDLAARRFDRVWFTWQCS